MPEVEMIGVYRVDSSEPCHLIELVVHESEGRFDLGQITQRQAGVDRTSWQVPYAERLLEPSGEGVLVDVWDRPGLEQQWMGEVRLAFFLHYLDLGAPLLTPFGEVELPKVLERPARLSDVVYEPPD